MNTISSSLDFPRIYTSFWSYRLKKWTQQQQGFIISLYNDIFPCPCSSFSFLSSESCRPYLQQLNTLCFHYHVSSNTNPDILSVTFQYVYVFNKSNSNKNTFRCLLRLPNGKNWFSESQRQPSLSYKPLFSNLVRQFSSFKLLKLKKFLPVFPASK